ncbi:MAG TPA: MBL fold metallo-hydrolase [Anaerolineales bacterium]|nr:MBL fold metallo-hydrolase [Anaerolineales bacterium]
MARTIPTPTRVTVTNVGYLSTNYWVISAGRSRLLVDLGYPGTMGKLRARLKQMDIPLEEIRYALATHYHIDHAGLAQELKLAGARLIVLESQVEAIPLMKRFTKPRDHYVEISLDGNLTISFSQSRGVLTEIGLSGEILYTPGHSPDSVSLLLDDGSAFTGDLAPKDLVWGEAGELVAASWELLIRHGAKCIYPAHGPIRPIDIG